MNVTSFNDNSVPTGGFAISLSRGAGAGTVLGTYVLESFTPTRPSKLTERPDYDGGPNGWKAVNAQENASGVLQIATSATTFPQRGDWFTLTADPAIANEKWVIVDFSEPFEAGMYYKQNVTLKKAYFS